MNEDVLEQLRAQVRAPLAADKVTEDKRLKAEILLMRSHAHVVEDKPGHFVCEVGYGSSLCKNYPPDHQTGPQWRPEQVQYQPCSFLMHIGTEGKE